MLYRGLYAALDYFGQLQSCGKTVTGSTTGSSKCVLNFSEDVDAKLT